MKVKRSSIDREHERRSYPRYQVQKIVSYAHGHKKLLPVTLDLAMSGMKIKTHYTLPQNENLNFKLVLGKNSISPEGRVAYGRILAGKQNVSGIQFVELSVHDVAFLQEYFSLLK